MSTEPQTNAPVSDKTETAQSTVVQPTTAPPVDVKVDTKTKAAEPQTKTPVVNNGVDTNTANTDGIVEKLHPSDARITTDIEKAIAVLKDLDHTTQSQVAVAQKSFLTGIIRGLTTGPVEDSVTFLGNLLVVINANTAEGKCFSPLYVFREWHRLNIQHELVIEYEQMLSILVDTSNPATRKTAVKSISFRTYFTAIKTPYRERVIDVMQRFYHLD
jgi:hypothetical protein